MLRQKIMILYLTNSSLDSQTIGWAFYDGTGKTPLNPAVDQEVPYKSVLDAMKDGWRVIQMPVLGQRTGGRELETDYLEWEFVLEKLEQTDGE